MSEQELSGQELENEATLDAEPTTEVAPQATEADISPTGEDADPPAIADDPTMPAGPTASERETQAPQPEARPKPLFCRKCGTPIPEGQPFCGQCGTPVSRETATATPTAGLPKGLLIGVAAVVVVAAVGIALFASGVLGPKAKPEPEPFDFAEEFSDYEGKSWCTFGDDGSYMAIDTNPYDISDYIDPDAYQAIQDTNDKLGFPDSTTENMNHTRALDGTQTDEIDGFEVRWRYHPDSGMEVTYERTDSAPAEEE